MKLSTDTRMSLLALVFVLSSIGLMLLGIVICNSIYSHLLNVANTVLNIAGVLSMVVVLGCMVMGINYLGKQIRKRI